ncbi:hypothetical protein [Erwinia amylovora]
MKSYVHAINDNNSIRAKGAGYYLSRVTVAASIVVLVVSLPLTIYAGLRCLGGSLPVIWFVAPLLMDMVLLTYVIKKIKSKRLKGVVAGMKEDGCFNPSSREEQIMPAQQVYMGIDIDSGVIGIAALYAQGAVRNKRTYFEAETIESWEYNEGKLTMNLRNRNIPTIELVLINAGAAYRQLEMVTRMYEQHQKYRGEKYMGWRKAMLDKGWMLPRTY